MAATFILLSIGIPWLGALLVWWIGDQHPKLQHTLAVVFSVLAGGAALCSGPPRRPVALVWAASGAVLSPL